MYTYHFHHVRYHSRLDSVRCLWPWFDPLSNLCRAITTIILPAYLSYKSLRTADPAQTTPWLIYFLILSLALLFESWTVFILGWIPFYSWFRLFFFLYLVLPQTQGAKVVYLQYVEPYIVHHETQIDNAIGEVHAKLQSMGLGYLNILVEYIRDKILGQQSPQAERSSAAGASRAGYAQDLLSRFAMPAARTSALASAGSGVYGLLSAMGTNTNSGSSSSNNRSLNLPTDFSNRSAGDKSAFLSSQREHLTSLLRALDQEQQSLDLAYGSGIPAPLVRNSSSRPSSSGGGLKAKSRSEQSFEHLEHDDTTMTPSSSTQSTPPRSHDNNDNNRRTASGGWVPASVSGCFGGASGGGASDQNAAVNRGWRQAMEITEAVTEAVQGRSSGFDAKR